MEALRNFFLYFYAASEGGLFSAERGAELVVLFVAGVGVSAVDPLLRRRERARIRREHAAKVAERKAMRNAQRAAQPNPRHSRIKHKRLPGETAKRIPGWGP